MRLSRPASDGVVMIGPMPPPVHGAAKNFRLIHERLSKLAPVWLLSTSTGRMPKRTLAYGVHRAAALLRAASVLLGLLAARRVRSVYMSVDAGAGMTAMLWIARLSAAFGVPVFLHHRSFKYLNTWQRVAQRLFEVSPDRVLHIVLCSEMERLARDRYGAAYRCEVVSNFAIPFTSGVASRPFEAIQGPLTVGHFSNLSAAKGFDHVEALMRRYGPQGQFRLVLAGTVQSHDLRTRIARLLSDFPDQVRFIGPLTGREQIDAFFGSIDAFVFPTVYPHEAEPNVVIEALLRGCSAVTTPAGCLVSYAERGLVSTIAPDHFVDGFGTWLAHALPGLDAARAQRARRAADAEAEVGREARKLEALLDRVAQRRGAPGEPAVVMAGPFPPPLHGMAAVNVFMAAELRRRGIEPLTVDLSPGLSQRTALYKARKVWVGLRGIYRLFNLVRRSMRRGTLYLSLSGGLGRLNELPLICLARLSGWQVVLHHHSFAYLERPSALTSLVALVAGPGQIHIALCDEMGQLIRQRFGMHHRLMVLSNLAFPLLEQGMAPRQHVTFREAVNRPMRVGFISLVSFAKGVERFVTAAAALRASGLQVQAVIAGPYANAAAQRFVEAKLREHPWLEYLGFVSGPDKRAFFASLDLLLFPTCYENEAEPLVVYEALLAGVRVVAFRRGCLATLAKQLEGVLVVDTVEQMVAQAQEILCGRRPINQDAIATALRAKRAVAEVALEAVIQVMRG